MDIYMEKQHKQNEDTSQMYSILFSLHKNLKPINYECLLILNSLK